jgi:FKBP-type peptidyl-prolyl cis-trans isomerase SlpA
MSPSRSDRRIGRGDRVRLHFSIHLEAGEEVDTTRRGKPATLVIGDGNLLPGFEAVLLGMRPGDDARIPLEPEEAFGPHRQENVRLIRRDRFGADMALEEGVMISFAGPGGELPGVVRRIMEESVEVDFNHPWAGRRIVFDVSILAVGDD